MVYGSRMGHVETRTKPLVVLDQRFPFIHSKELGDRGQIEAVIEVESKSLEMDGNGNEIIVYTLTIKSAKDLTDTKARI